MKSPIAERLQQAMDAKGVSIAQAAEAIGAGLSTAYRWLEGSRPQGRTASALADFLQVRKVWLLDGEGVMQPTDAKAELPNESVQDRLRIAIAVANIPKTHLAEKLGVHPVTMSRWLKNRMPDASAISQLAAVLKVNQEWLLTGQGPMDLPGESTTANASAVLRISAPPGITRIEVMAPSGCEIVTSLF